MLTYLSPRTGTHMPHSSSPLNPQRSSSPPLSSPTPTPHALPKFSLPSVHSTPTSSTNASTHGQSYGYSRTQPQSSPTASRSSPSARPLSTRYTRTMPASSIASRRPRAGSSSPMASASTSSPTADVFGDGATPTQNAMWRDRLQRRMADRERRKQARANDLARRRGTAGYEDEDDEEAERRAQEDDEELFRRLMVLQRRREQHAFAGYTGESVEFWQDELDALAREEQAICARLNSAMDTDDTPTPSSHLSRISEEEDRWAREAAEAEAVEAMHDHHAYGYEHSDTVETAHGYDDIHWELEADEDTVPEMELGPEDWAAIQAMEAAMDTSEAMDVEM